MKLTTMLKSYTAVLKFYTRLEYNGLFLYIYNFRFCTTRRKLTPKYLNLMQNKFKKLHRSEKKQKNQTIFSSITLNPFFYMETYNKILITRKLIVLALI